ncbi:MAG: hypothetical protein P8179_02910 [Candidatus Thiodiazotropha sp.]
MKCALGVGQGKDRSYTSVCPQHLCIHARHAIARYFKALQRRQPSQVCDSRCSMIHPIGDHVLIEP